ncbi:discoidin domain-containing protein [Lysinibacillus sphaericus]|uniref:discoidin domain-containing protein n=1 Tax=Lysinibacillus sphaericus TaxID=1421 RepID=UPI003D73EA9A
MPILNNKQIELSFNKIYYVDATNGSDSNSGSKISPFQSVNFAITKCSLTGDAIFAFAGTHDVTRVAGDYDSGGLWDDNKEIYFFGENKKTIFLCDGNKHKGRDTHCIMFQNKGTKAYNITFDFKVGSRTNNYQTSISGIGGGAVRGEVINCLFKIDYTAPSFTYSNSATSVIKFLNCTFDVKGNFMSSYSGAGFTIENCVSNFSFYGEGTRKNIYKATFDENYHITNYDESSLNIGVYTGLSSWLSKWSLSAVLINSKNKIYIPITVEKSSTENLSKYVKNVTASGGLTPEKTIDGMLSSSWYFSGSVTSAWIKYEFNNPIGIDSLSIYSCYLSGYEAIKDFSFEASETGYFTGEQTVLYEGTHPNETSTFFIDYSFKNNKKFKYYRINVKNIYIGNGGNNLSILEVQFWKKHSTLNILRVDTPSKENFINYGSPTSFLVNGTIETKLYLLKNGEKEDSNRFLSTQIENKPLKISFK